MIAQTRTLIRPHLKNPLRLLRRRRRHRNLRPPLKRDQQRTLHAHKRGIRRRSVPERSRRRLKHLIFLQAQPCVHQRIQIRRRQQQIQSRRLRPNLQVERPHRRDPHPVQRRNQGLPHVFRRTLHLRTLLEQIFSQLIILPWLARRRGLLRPRPLHHQRRRSRNPGLQKLASLHYSRLPRIFDSAWTGQSSHQVNPPEGGGQLPSICRSSTTRPK